MSDVSRALLLIALSFLFLPSLLPSFSFLIQEMESETDEKAQSFFFLFPLLFFCLQRNRKWNKKEKFECFFSFLSFPYFENKKEKQGENRCEFPYSFPTFFPKGKWIGKAMRTFSSFFFFLFPSLFLFREK